MLRAWQGRPGYAGRPTNAGFLVFNKARVSGFLADWASAYEKDALRENDDNDQRTLRSTLFDSTIRFYVLPAEYHCMLWEASYVCGEVTLLHGRHYPPLQKICVEVNEARGARIFKVGLIRFGGRFSYAV